jgi:hypothetical protein
MPHFISPRTREQIDGHTILVAPGETRVWLTGEGTDDLTVVPDNGPFDLGITGPMVVAGDRRDDFQEWIVTGLNMQSMRLRAVSAGILPSDSLTFASCTIMFRAAAVGGGPITVHPITGSIFGTVDRNGLAPVTLPARPLVVPSSLRRGDPSNVLEFDPGTEIRARVGVFAAKQDGVERAALLLVPSSGAPERVLVGITHVFGQSAANRAHYNRLGWSNPRSPDLIKWVTNKFLGEHWGRQAMASGDSRALLLPVRAMGDGHGHGELGPFAHAAFMKKVLHLIAAETEAFAPQKVEMFSFSSGIYALNGLLPGMRGSLAAVYNIDPTGGTAAGVPHGVKAWQVLSGFTTHGKGRPGFELLSENRWAHEPSFKDRKDKSKFPDGVSDGYLHNFVMPYYCLYLGIKT